MLFRSTFNQPQISFRPETLTQLFPQTEPVANDVGGFLAFSSTSQNILPRPLQTQTLQQVPMPLQQVTPSPKNTIQDNFAEETTANQDIFFQDFVWPVVTSEDVSLSIFQVWGGADNTNLRKESFKWWYDNEKTIFSKRY